MSWDELTRRVAENDATDGSNAPFRREVMELLRKKALDVEHATKKITVLRISSGEWLAWNLEKPANRFYTLAKHKRALEERGLEAKEIPFRHGERDGGRHSGLSRAWSFEDCLTSAPMGQFEHIAERRVSGSS